MVTLPSRHGDKPYLIQEEADVRTSGAKQTHVVDEARLSALYPVA